MTAAFSRMHDGLSRFVLRVLSTTQKDRHDLHTRVSLCPSISVTCSITQKEGASHKFTNTTNIQSSTNNMTFLTRTTLILALAAALSLSSKASSCVHTSINDTCAPGCWSPDNVFDHDTDTLLCIPVEAGFYSPADSNEHMKCELGFVARDSQASECTSCPTGTMATPDHTACVPCLAGTYQDEEGQVLCKQCNPSQYKGQGANAITKDGYCLLIDNTNDDNNTDTLSFTTTLCIRT